MNSTSPNWASPPGDTIKDILLNSKINRKDFFESLGISDLDGSQLLDGSLEINPNLANLLSSILGSTPNFWLTRETQYQEDKRRLEENYLAKSWTTVLPLADMVKRRWIAPNLRGDEKLKACLDYFGVESFLELSHKYKNWLHSVAFRASDSFDAVPESVITWLRQGEIQYEKSSLEPFNRQKLISSLDEIKQLTNEPDPQIFIPRLQKILAKCGVALAISPTPKGCSASGAVYFVSDSHAVILLSFRYLSDDHFWFTLFHECAHLILHLDKGLLLEGVTSNIERVEQEANEYASQVLVPEKYKTELLNLNGRNLRGILKFAKKMGVSKGIIVGQLQHHGIISYKYLNKLKVRYSW